MLCSGTSQLSIVHHQIVPHVPARRPAGFPHRPVPLRYRVVVPHRDPLFSRQWISLSNLSASVCWRPYTPMSPRFRIFCGPRMVYRHTLSSPPLAVKNRKGHPRLEEWPLPMPLNSVFFLVSPRGTRTLNPLIKSLLVGSLSASTSIHECRIFQGFGSLSFRHYVLKCAAVYPVGCQFGCHEEAAMQRELGCHTM